MIPLVYYLSVIAYKKLDNFFTVFRETPQHMKHGINPCHTSCGTGGKPSQGMDTLMWFDHAEGERGHS